MIGSQPDRDPVECLADEFISRCRAGENPSIAEYIGKYPQFAEQIEELFPAVAMMEHYRHDEHLKRRASFRDAHGANVPTCVGDFKIVQEIGRGGMGIVFEAQQQSLARRVAVKILPRNCRSFADTATFGA